MSKLNKSDILPHFSYVNEITDGALEDRPWKVEKINATGTRNSGKTKSLEIKSVELLFVTNTHKGRKIRTASQWVRLESARAVETYEQLKDLIEENYPQMHNHVQYNSIKRTIKFGGNEIRVLHLTSNKKQSGHFKLLGLKRLMNVDYGLIILEEASEYTQEHIIAVIEQAGAWKNLMQIKIANPWVITNEFIKYCDDNFPYDERLGATGKDRIKNQYWFNDEKKEIFHYSQWSTNPWMFENEIMVKTYDEIRRYMPGRSRIVNDGLPGAIDGGVYDSLDNIMSIKDITNNPEMLVGGVDWGYSQDSTTCGVIGIGEEDAWIGVYDEWVHNPKKDHPLTEYQKVGKVVDFYEDICYEGATQINTIEVFVDNAENKKDNSGSIYMLREEAIRRGIPESIIHFKPSYKPPINRRISTFNYLMAAGFFYLDKDNCSILWNELNNSIYDDKFTVPKRLDGNDHSINWLEYAMSMYLLKFIKTHESMFGSVEYHLD